MSVHRANQRRAWPSTRLSPPEPASDINLEIGKAYVTALHAQRKLHDLIKKGCPGPHEYIQHGDGRKPWCPTCHFQSDGTRRIR